MKSAASQFIVPRMTHAKLICSAAALAAPGGSNRAWADPGMGNPAATPSFSQNYNSTYFGNSFATTDLGAAAAGGANGRFVRITRLDNNYWMTFAEMEVIGSQVPLQYTAATNLAAGKPRTTSS